MKTKSTKDEKVHVVTLGCSKNLYDSELIMGRLQTGRILQDLTHEDPHTVLINTCGFIGDAKEESIDTILHWIDAKEQGRTQKIIVMGCLSERYMSDLKAEMPEVDGWYGTHDFTRILKTLKADYRKELVGERLITTPSHYAYFKISEGCDRTCSFCAIPLMRGGHTSFPMEDLVNQASNLARKGVKELLLIAQDLTFYGIDIYGKRMLNELLLRLADVEGIEWIRLHYAYPSAFPEEILPTIRDRTNICNYLDMPLQHISDYMLKRMRRMSNAGATNRLLEKIRNTVPDIAIRTTLISGFPGERNVDHEMLLGWLEEQRFDRVGVFTYSHEEDTTAHLLKDDVPEEVKKRRMEEVMAAQQDISLAHNLAKVGSVQKVLIDRAESGYWVGRTEHDSPEVDNEVFIPVDATRGWKSGSFYKVKVDSVEPYDLFALPH
ncbi:MAG TPA: 30S ribosomal protein S12 methylthiotransferase RimO [Flavobacteriales bacterium]|jgi:ribosomal protein S12 methylthiotransferase|nr:30S ribosomal protein S12 methylthiotransferase RimO [Flavobacteriales bacterium]